MAEYQLSYESELVPYPLRFYYLTSPSSIYLNADITSLFRTHSNYTTDTMNRPKKTGARQPYEAPLFQLWGMP